MAIFSDGLSKKSMINPRPLHIAEIIEIIAKSTLDNITINGKLMLMAIKVIPPTRPRFSTSVQSAKYAKHEGMPNPNEIPQRRVRLKVFVIVVL